MSPLSKLSITAAQSIAKFFNPKYSSFHRTALSSRTHSPVIPNACEGSSYQSTNKISPFSRDDTGEGNAQPVIPNVCEGSSYQSTDKISPFSRDDTAEGNAQPVIPNAQPVIPNAQPVIPNAQPVIPNVCEGSSYQSTDKISPFSRDDTGGVEMIQAEAEAEAEMMLSG